MLKSFPNRQWKFVIVDMEDGSIVGTDDEKVVKEFAQSEQNFVIDMMSCQVVTVEGEEEETHLDAENIPEQQSYKF